MSLTFWSSILALSVTLVVNAEPWALDRILEEAGARAPDTRIAAERLRSARAFLREANAAFWPRLQLQSSYQQTDNPTAVFGAILNQRAFAPGMDFNNVPDADDLNVRGLLTIPLYAGGANRAGREAAKAGARAGRAEAEAIHHALQFEAVRAFFSAHKLRQFGEATRSAVSSLQTNLWLAQKRHDAGTLLRTELLDLEVKLAQAQEDQLRAENAARLALHSLRNLLGIEDSRFEIADAPPEERFNEPPQRPRPEIEMAQARLRAAEADLDRARAGYRPRAQASSSVDYDRGWELDGDGSSYTAGVILQWDLWDGDRTRARVRQAESAVQIHREQLRKLELDLAFEMEQARVHLAEAAERVIVTQRGILQARESAGLIQTRFEQGLALSSQVIDSQTALTTAQVRHAEALADQRIAQAALKKACGWPQRPENTSPGHQGNHSP